MPSQQALDDLLEALIALTEGADVTEQRDRLLRLVLMLTAQMDDTAHVHQAIARLHPIELAIP